MAQGALVASLPEVCRDCDGLNPPGTTRCVLCGRSLDGLELTLPPEPGQAEVLETTAQVEREEGEAIVTERVARVPASEPPTVPAGFPAAPESRAPALAAGALPPGWGGAGPLSRSSAPPLTRASASEVVVCAQCRARNPAGARFCGSCGTSLVAPKPQTKGTLILVRGFSGEAKQFPLTVNPVTAGRTGTIAFPEDPYVGATHATFFLHGEEIIVRDEGTPNGIYVRLRESQPLRPGDSFSMGEHLLRYVGVVNPPSNPARHGSPRTADRFHVLEELLEGGGVGRVCRRPGPVITVGRAACDLSFPTDGFISSRHAELAIVGDQPHLRDVGSANGTFMRVPPHSDRVLHHGDYLLLGRELMRVEVALSR